MQLASSWGTFSSVVEKWGVKLFVDNLDYARSGVIVNVTFRYDSLRVYFKLTIYPADRPIISAVKKSQPTISNKYNLKKDFIYQS